MRDNNKGSAQSNSHRNVNLVKVSRPMTIILLSLIVAAPGCSAPATSADATRGKQIFHDMQCFTCHESGRNLIVPSRPISGEIFQKRYPEDKQIADLIRSGVPGTAMPSFSADRLSNLDLTDLIAYVRSFSEKSKGKHKS
jgi:mono/diheme cytochrome c family protein